MKLKVVFQSPQPISLPKRPTAWKRSSSRAASCGLWFASIGTPGSSTRPARGDGLSGDWRTTVASKSKLPWPDQSSASVRYSRWPRLTSAASSSYWRRSPLKLTDCGSDSLPMDAVPCAPTVPNEPYEMRARPGAWPGLWWITWMTPTNDVAPYMTGAAPRITSMRSTSTRSIVVSCGLYAPPYGTPSTTSRNASNSRRPQNAGTEPAGPPSPPGEISTPATSASAERRSVAPRARISSSVMIVTDAGMSITGSASRVAVTCTRSRRRESSAWAAGAASASRMAAAIGARVRLRTDMVGCLEL